MTMLKVKINMLLSEAVKPGRVDPVIVCHCHQVTDREIKAAVDSGAHTLEAIGATCGAGSGCGGCTSEIVTLLFQRRRVLPLVKNFMHGSLEAAS